MGRILIVVGCLLVGCSGQATAQEPSARIDLDMLAALPRSQLVVGRIGFAETAATCPLHFGTIRFSPDGSMDHLTALGLLYNPRFAQLATTELDDETYRHRVATD